MKFYLAIAVCFLLVGCGTDGVTPVDTGAAAASIADIRGNLAEAQANLKSDKPDLKAASTSITAAQQGALTAAADLKKVQADADAMAKAKAKSDRDKAYYQAIAENNVKLMLGCLLGGGLIFWLGETGKGASPYTVLLPNVVAGMLAVMIFAVVACSIYELWSTFGWLIHLI